LTDLRASVIFQDKAFLLTGAMRISARRECGAGPNQTVSGAARSPAPANAAATPGP